MPLAELYRDDGAAHLTPRAAAISSPPCTGAAGAGAALRAIARRARAARIDFPLAGVAVALAGPEACVAGCASR